MKLHSLRFVTMTTMEKVIHRLSQATLSKSLSTSTEWQTTFSNTISSQPIRWWHSSPSRQQATLTTRLITLLMLDPSTYWHQMEMACSRGRLRARLISGIELTTRPLRRWRTPSWAKFIIKAMMFPPTMWTRIYILTIRAKAVPQPSTSALSSHLLMMSPTSKVKFVLTATVTQAQARCLAMIWRECLTNISNSFSKCSTPKALSKINSANKDPSQPITPTPSHSHINKAK